MTDEIAPEDIKRAATLMLALPKPEPVTAYEDFDGNGYVVFSGGQHVGWVPKGDLTIREMRDPGVEFLDALVTEWPGVASWNDPIVDYDVDHEVK